MATQKGYPNLKVQEPKFRPELAIEAAEVLRSTNSLRKTAAIVGVSRETLKKWPRKSPQFKEAFERWQERNWNRQAYRGLLARENLKVKGKLDGSENSAPQEAVPEPAPTPSKHQDPMLIGPGHPLFESDEEMWQRWEERQQQARDAELEAEIEKRRGMWTGY